MVTFHNKAISRRLSKSCVSWDFFYPYTNVAIIFWADSQFFIELAQSVLSLKSVEWLKTISLRLVECPRSSFVKCYMKVYQNDVCTHSVSCRTWSGIASCQNSRDATCCVRESMRLRVKPARTRTYYMHPHARKRTMFKLSFPEKRWMDSNDKPKVGWMLLYGKCYLVTCYLL